MAVISVACEFGKEHGIIRENPVKGVRRIPTPRAKPLRHQSGPGPKTSARTVLAEVPHQLRVAVALAMFTGLRKGDVLAFLPRTQFGRWPHLAQNRKDRAGGFDPYSTLISCALLQEAPAHNAVTIAPDDPPGTPWTVEWFQFNLHQSNRQTGTGRKGRRKV